MLLIFFKRLNAIPIYNFMIGILFFALFFPNSNLISFLYSQLGYTEFGTNLASSAFYLYTQNAVLLVGKVSQTLRINHTFGYIINSINFFLSIYFMTFLFLSHVLLLLPRLFFQHLLMAIVLQMNM